MLRDPLYTLKEAAKLLNISVTTLRDHVKFGRIRSVVVGGGTKRKLRRLTQKNIDSFIERQKRREIPPPCPSINLPKARIMPTTFKSTVAAFSDLPKPGTEKQPNK